VALSPTDAMVVHKTQFMKSCAKLGWYAASRQIWQTLAPEDSSLSLHEFDLKSAELVSSFRSFAHEKFGSAAGAFRAIDKHNTKQVRMPEFVAALHVLGFHRNLKSLFHGLDRHGRKSVTEEDLLFIDEWKPQPFLLAAANADAANEIKAALLERCGTYLRAWRRMLDKDNTNRCSWPQFQAACVSLQYNGDVAGAWRYLDSDFSGHISYQELDEASARVLLEFKAWATEEFGSLISAFQVFDEDDSREVTKQEFCTSCRTYNYIGKPTHLFHCLDVDGEGTLTLEEVCFLDGWETQEKQEETSEPEQPQQLQQLQQQECQSEQPQPPRQQMKPRPQSQPLQQLKQPTPPSSAISDVMRFLPRPSLDGCGSGGRAGPNTICWRACHGGCGCSNARKTIATSPLRKSNHSIYSGGPASLHLCFSPSPTNGVPGPTESDLNMSSGSYHLPGNGFWMGSKRQTPGPNT